MIRNYLFETNALKVSDHTQPFWYASNTFGPFFINTHYLFGSETQAKDFLKYIDDNASQKEKAPILFRDKVSQQYQNNGIFKDVIDQLVESIEDTVNVSQIDYISGGERRDWFFSYMVAVLLDKPHITVFKDLYSNVLVGERVEETPDLSGKRVIHVCDLVTLASSYLKSWIPALKKHSGKLLETFTVVDRCQGGKEILQEEGIQLISLVNIDENLFTAAKEQSIINQEQFDMVLSFMKDLEKFMNEYIRENPDFLSKSLQKGGKDQERAEAFQENFYKR
ncbi:MAG TPA: orotate phosphoribosyltransferase [Clostridiales bacterium]|nr:orotate phosphoribosyltransferase [Clostridiales bacterium]